MMPLAIDPSEMRAPGRPAKAPAPRKVPGKSPGKAARPILLAALGCVGLVGLSAGSYAMLSGLAGPQVSKNQVAKVRIGPIAADMPDLRDGVPALAPVVTTARPAPEPAPLAREAATSPLAPVAAAAPRSTEASLAAKPAAPAKAVRVPPIENAVLVAPVRTAALVPVARTAALVAPSAGETTRSRVSTASTSFAALPPEPTANQPASPRQKPVPATAARAKPTAGKPAAGKPAASTQVATAAPPSQPSAAPESEETEVFGMKVPSLAPAGRRFVEGVQALGNAVKSLPDQF